MNYLKLLLFSGVAAISLAAFATLPSNNDGPTVVSLDHGSLDTLVELGLENKVLAVPMRGLPGYLDSVAEDRADAGGLKTPDMDAIRAVGPELILVTGRQGESMEELKTIGKIRNVGLQGESYKDSVTARVTELATLYGLEETAQASLADLWHYVDQQRESITGDPEVVVITHNKGKFSLRDEPAVFELLALKTSGIPEGVESVTRGTRTFIPVTPEVVAEMAPDVLFIVDRSAAIGDTPMALDSFMVSLKAAGAETSVTLLDPGLWYLSGGGLQSIRLQVDEVVSAVN